MPPFGLVGPSYTSQAINAECQKTLNFYVEAMESGQGKSPMVLYPTPGLKIVATIPGARSIRGQKDINNRWFVVASTTFCEFTYDPLTNIFTRIDRGIVADDRLPVSMAASPQQLLIASAGHTYVFTLATNVFTSVQIPNTDPQMITKVSYSDSFFNALKADSQQWFISKSFDALTWDPLDTTIISVFTDNAVSSLMDHRKLWLFGQKHTVVYYISGNVFPYDVLDPIIEQGCIAKDSPAQLDNSVFWLGGDERGAGIVWRAQGQTPIRISNHAIEFAMQGYSTMTDARSYAYQDQGHSFYHLYFPTANKSWRYDVATNMWCEVDYFDAGVSIAHRSQNHTFIFGKHIVGDWKTATLYEMKIPQFVNGTWEFADDFGNPIRRVRRAPHISKDNKILRYIKLEVFLEAGLGTPDIVDVGPPGLPGGDPGPGVTRPPKLNMRYSNDYGHTWSNEQTRSAGLGGEYRKRIAFWRMGHARDRVIEINCSDKVPFRIVGDNMEVYPGTVLSGKQEADAAAANY